LEDDSPIEGDFAPSAMKETLHPASTSAATEKRLLTKPERWYPRHTSRGRFQRRRSMVCVVVILLPPGWIMVIWMSTLVMAAAGAVFVRRVHEAIMSIRAVSSKLGGLAQLHISPLTLFAKLDLTTSTSMAT
jgi:hypothetical protein